MDGSDFRLRVKSLSWGSVVLQDGGLLWLLRCLQLLCPIHVVQVDLLLDDLLRLLQNVPLHIVFAEKTGLRHFLEVGSLGVGFVSNNEAHALTQNRKFDIVLDEVRAFRDFEEFGVFKPISELTYKSSLNFILSLSSLIVGIFVNTLIIFL